MNKLHMTGKRKIFFTISALICLALVFTVSCSNTGTPEAEANPPPESILLPGNTAGNDDYIDPPYIIPDVVIPDTVPEEMGITLNLIEYDNKKINLHISNKSDYVVEFNDGYEIEGERWGSMGTAGYKTFNLLPGESREFSLESMGPDGFLLNAGEFRLTLDIIVDPNSTSPTTYLLHTDFAIENADIPSDMTEFIIEIDLATPIGVLLNIINGTSYGRVYFDKSYEVQQRELADYVGAEWKEIPTIASRAFPKSSTDTDNKDSIAPRQIYEMYTIYWEWLYGELEPGDYRIEMNIYHDDGEGNIVGGIVYAYFTLDGEPIPDSIPWLGGDFYHPFAGISTFRTDVLALIGKHYNQVTSDNTGLLVKSSEPFWEGNTDGSLFYIINTHSLTVLDSNNNQIIFTDIPVDAVIDITFSGMILTSNPAIIGANLLIRIVE